MSDDELMAALGEAVAEADAVSDRRREAARAAFTWRTVDAELAELLHDSALDAGAAVRRRRATSRGTLSFGSGGLALEVEVDGDHGDGPGRAGEPPRPSRCRGAAGDEVVGRGRRRRVLPGRGRRARADAVRRAGRRLDADQPLGRALSAQTNGGPTAARCRPAGRVIGAAADQRVARGLAARRPRCWLM